MARCDGGNGGGEGGKLSSIVTRAHPFVGIDDWTATHILSLK